jgi:transcriptional regulator with XRE-family HTH domain
MSEETSPRGRLREHVAEEIRVLLARRKMSAAELARRAGLKQSTLARRMTGETAFDMDDLEVIADVLEVAVTDLMPQRVGAAKQINER